MSRVISDKPSFVQGFLCGKAIQNGNTTVEFVLNEESTEVVPPIIYSKDSFIKGFSVGLLSPGVLFRASELEERHEPDVKGKATIVPYFDAYSRTIQIIMESETGEQSYTFSPKNSYLTVDGMDDVNGNNSNEP